MNDGSVRVLHDARWQPLDPVPIVGIVASVGPRFTGANHVNQISYSSSGGAAQFAGDYTATPDEDGVFTLVHLLHLRADG